MSFRQFLDQRRDEAARAYVNGDAAPVVALTAEHPPVTFFGPGGGVVTGAGDIVAAYREGAGMFGDGGESRLEILQAQESGDLAFWCGVQHATVRMAGGGDAVEMPLRITEVFRREGSDWRLVHRHAAPL